MDTVWTNCYAARPENILLCMLCDNEARVREEAVNIILSIRGQNETGDRDPLFRCKPKVRIGAANYTEMIDWNRKELAEPVFTRDLSNNQIKDIALEPFVLPERIGIHAQACESQVQKTAASKCVGFEARDGHIKGAQKLRDLMPILTQKRTF